MLKLIKLELKKFKIGIKGVVISNLCILVLVALAIFLSKNTDDMIFESFDMIFTIAETMVRAVFIVFTGVMISKLIIDEYNNKTIYLMFTYPISRKKIMIAKLAIISIFIFVSMVLSNIFQFCSAYLINIVIKYYSYNLTQYIIVKKLISIIVYSAVFTFLSLIPTYVGIKKKSTSSTIVASIILAFVLNSGNGEDSLSSIIIIPIILAAVGIVTSYLAIKDVEDVDVIN